MEAKITRKVFAEGYAARSGMTVRKLKAIGREARPCCCGWDGCDGWQMAHVGEERRFGNRWPKNSPMPLPRTWWMRLPGLRWLV